MTTMLRTTGQMQARPRVAAVVLAGLVGMGGSVAWALPASAAAPAIGVNVTPVEKALPETSPTVGVNVTVTNPGDEAVALTSTVADLSYYGDPVTTMDSSCFVGTSLAPGGSTTCTVTAQRPRVSMDPIDVGVTVKGSAVSGAQVSSRGVTQVGFKPEPGTIDGSITTDKAEIASGDSVTFTLKATVTAPTGRFRQVDYVTTDRFGSPWDLSNRNFVPQKCYPGNHSPYPDDYECAFTAKLTGTPGELLTTTMTARGEGQTITRQVSVRIAGGTRTVAQWADAATAWPAVKVGKIDVTRATRVSSVFSAPRQCRSLGRTTLGDLLAADAPTRGRCADQTRLVRAATAAVLNEASSADYPAESVSAVRSETSHALRGRTRHVLRLTQKYDGWNGEVAKPEK